jgi:hypothetical protein
MKMISKVVFVGLFIFFYLLINAGTVLAYEVSWYSIQHRVYEDKANYNRLMFEIQDDSGNDVSSKSAVTGVVLKYPNGTIVTLGDLMFKYYQYISAQFDPDSSQWNHYSPQMISAYYPYNVTYKVLN